MRDGKVVPGSYQASPNHRLLTKDGFFRLGRFLNERLQQELVAQEANRQKSTNPNP